MDPILNNAIGPGRAEEFKGNGTTGNKESPSSKDPVALRWLHNTAPYRGVIQWSY